MSTALGGTWLTAWKRLEARDLLVACLDMGFDALVPAPGARPYPWADLARVWEDLPIRASAVRVESLLEAPESSFASKKLEDVQAVKSRVGRAAALARALGTQTLILEAPRLPVESFEEGLGELGDPAVDWTPEKFQSLQVRLSVLRDRFLEVACRQLYALAGEFSEFRLCLSESSDAASLSGLDSLEAMLSDLSRQQIGYWARPAVIQRRCELGGENLGDQLEALEAYMVGADYSDSAPGQLLLPPGTGKVDFGLLAPYMRGLQIQRPGVLELGSATTSDEVRQARGYLERFGL